MSGLLAIWRSIWRFHRLFAGILVLEYALTFAIVVDASGVFFSRAQAILQPSGIAERNLYVLQGTGINRPLHRRDMSDALGRFATLAGEKRVALASSAPFLGMYSQSLPVTLPGTVPQAVALQVNAYEGDARLPRVFGLRLRQGRWFQPDEVAQTYGDTTHLTIISDSLATSLFHGGNAVGRQIAIAGQIHTIVGVVDPLAAPQYLGRQRTTHTLLVPRTARNLLLIRYQGRATDLQTALAALNRRDEGKVRWTLSSYAAVRARYFRSDFLTVAALAGVLLAVLATALCGILGLSNYWVAKRRPQIAIRRALGARKRDIDGYFLTESTLLVSTGLVLGIVLKLLADACFPDLQSSGGWIMWLFSLVITLLLSMLVVYASLRRWQRMSPSQLMRLY